MTPVQSAPFQVTDLDVTCPDLESEGNGVDAQEVCLDLVTQVHKLPVCPRILVHCYMASRESA